MLRAIFRFGVFGQQRDFIGHLLHAAWLA